MINNSLVVPANAGTHTARYLFLGAMLEAFAKHHGR
jgi:hypothetical protein